MPVGGQVGHGVLVGSNLKVAGVFVTPVFVKLVLI